MRIEHRVDETLDLPRIGDLAEPAGLDDRVGLPARPPHRVEHGLRHPPGDRPVGDPADQPAELCAGDLRVVDAKARPVERPRELAVHPVRREPCRVRRARGLDRGFEIVRHLAVAHELSRLRRAHAVLPGEPVAPLVGQLRKRAPHLRDERLVHGDREQVGIGEVAVVVRLLLVAHRSGLVALGVVEASFLDHLAPGLDDVDLALDLVGDGPFDESERVDVLDLRARAEGPGSGRAHGHVGVAAKRPFLHVAVADAEPPDQGVDLAHAGGRLGRAVDDRLGHDLEQRRARPVEVDPGRAPEPLVHRPAGVLLEVGADELDVAAGAAFRLDGDSPPRRDRVLVLADLVALRQVRVEVVLAREDASGGDAGADREAEPDRHPHRLAVEHRKHPGKPEVDRARLGVGRRSVAGRSTGKELAPGEEAGVHLQPDDRLPAVHRRPLAPRSGRGSRAALMLPAPRRAPRGAGGRGAIRLPAGSGGRRRAAAPPRGGFR